MYGNPEAISYQSIFVALHQMSAALPESSRNSPAYINASNTIALVKESTVSYIEVAEVEGVIMTCVSCSSFVVKPRCSLDLTPKCSYSAELSLLERIQ